MVAHLMLATGNMPKGTRFASLMRDLLGREPGTVPGQPEVGRRPEAQEPDAMGTATGTLTPEASERLIAAWVTGLGGKDERRKGTAGA